MTPPSTHSRRTALGVLGGAIAAVTGCSSVTSAVPDDGDDDGPMRFTYGDHPSQFAELSLPDASGPVPVVVIVHGGYWRASYGLELGRPLAVDLRAQGFAALNVEYRRMGDGGGWSHTGDDVAAAVDALTDHAAGLDLTRVVGLGHSAGGQLAGWLASARNRRVPLTGAVLQAGVLDLVRAADEGLGGGAVELYLGASPAADPAKYVQASPISLVPLGVPTVCVHGTGDDLVPIDQSQRFVAAAQAAGDRCELRTFGGDHFDPITVGTEAWQLCVESLRQLT